MKKKILFFIAIVSILVCALAMTVSARHEYTPLTDSALDALDVKITLTDGTNQFDANVKFKDLFNYTLTVAEGTTPYSLKLSGVKSTVNVNGTDYTLKDSMTAIYIPDGVTHLNSDFLRGYSTLSKACLADSIEYIGDCVFYKCGTFTLVNESGAADNYLPENLTAIGNANGTGSDHFLSGCALQNSMLIFPEGLTNFGCSYSFNDGFSQKDNMLILVFLGRMTNVNVANSVQNSAKFRFYFAKNNASDALVSASGTTANIVETRYTDNKWAYAYRNTYTGADISVAPDTTGKTLTISISNNDPNSTGSAGTYDSKDWYYLSGQAPIFYFCSGEKILTFRNGSFGWKVYASNPIPADDVHPFDDGGKTVEPTCTVGGGTRYSCGVCGAFMRLEDKTADALGHEYTEDDLVSSTTLGCLQDEAKTYKCQRCLEEFTVLVTPATGHDMSIISTPIEATYTSLGFKRIDCANCDYYTEYEYRLDPAGATMTIVLEDGTELSVLASLIFTSTFNEESQTASITGVKSSFTCGEKTYAIADVHKIIIPFGFNHVGYQFSNTSDIEVYDFSLTKDLILANGAFRDNHNVEQVILGDGTMPMADTFRAPNKLSSIVIADGATVVFPIGYHCFTDDTKAIQEFIIGEGANVNFAKEYFLKSGMSSSLKRIVIKDGATVNFANYSFKGLVAIEDLIIGKGCNITFGSSSFESSVLKSLTIPDSTTVSFGLSSFNKSYSLESINIGKNCNITIAENAFASSSALTSLIIPEGTNLVFSGNNSFRDCTALKTIFLPSCVTEVRKETFNGCTALETVALMGVKTIGEKAFYLSSASESTLTVFSHSTANLSINSSAFTNRANIVLYTMSTNITSLSSAAYTIYAGIPHAQYEAKLDPSCTENGYDGYATLCPCGTIVSDVTYTIYANDAEATTGSYGAHTVIPSLGEHTEKVIILYANGFDKNGEKTVGCAVCEAVLSDEITVVNPIFVHEGYSYKLRGEVTGIESAFKVNKEELKAYEEASGKKLNFGMIIVNPAYLGDSFFVNGKISASKAAIQVAIEIGDYSIFSCYISGFQKLSADVNLELVIAGYVYEGTDLDTFQIMQKTYAEGDESPAVSKVTKTDATLLTVNIANVQTPVAFPAEIKEFGAQA